jgi:hypothetical protein
VADGPHEQHLGIGATANRGFFNAQVHLCVAAESRESHDVEVFLQAAELQQVREGRSHVSTQWIFFEVVALRIGFLVVVMSPILPVVVDVLVCPAEVGGSLRLLFEVVAMAALCVVLVVVS